MHSRSRHLLNEYKTPEEVAQANQAIYLTGNPPQGGDVIRQFAITPSGTDFYSEECAAIAAAYDALPVCSPNAVELWQWLGEECRAQAAKLRHQYHVIRYDDIDPYNTAEEMHQDIERGIFKVTSLHSEHPIWDVDTNVDFRISHDLQGHGSTRSDFSLHGEVLAYQGQCAVTPEPLWPVLFTEIVGQICWCTTHHFFGPQKVGLIMLDQAEIDRHIEQITQKAESLKQSRAGRLLNDTCG